MLFLVLAVVAVLVPGSFAGKSAGIEQLSDKEFGLVTKEGFWFVEFYAPWCGWCKRLQPVWEELAAEVADKDVKVAQLDCIANPKACQVLGIQSFPTLKIFKDGQVYEFGGGERTLQVLRDFLAHGYKKVKPVPHPYPNVRPGQQQEDSEDVTLVVKKDDSKAEVHVIPLTEQTFADRVSRGKWLVAATAPWCGHCKALHPTLEALGKVKDAEFQVGNINCDEDGTLCRELGVKSFPTLFVVQGSYAYRYGKGERSEKAIGAFAKSGFESADRFLLPSQMVAAGGLPKRKGLTLLTGDTFDEATARDAWLVGFTCASAECVALEDALSQVQQSYSVHLRVGLVDCKESPDLCKEYGVSSTPAAVLLYRDRAFTYPGSSFDAADFTLFVGEGFKQAPFRQRKHLAMTRRLGWKTYRSAEAVEDFARQHRYLLVVCTLFAVLLWGVFLGSSLSHSPSAVIGAYRNAVEQQAEAKNPPNEYLVRKKKE